MYEQVVKNGWLRVTTSTNTTQQTNLRNPMAKYGKTCRNTPQSLRAILPQTNIRHQMMRKAAATANRRQNQRSLRTQKNRHQTILNKTKQNPSPNKPF
jgi:hypothetical protein